MRITDKLQEENTVMQEIDKKGNWRVEKRKQKEKRKRGKE